jgi:hypothetical protein
MMPEHTAEEHADMMAHPERWPLVTVLPLKRRSVRDESGFPQPGFLYQPDVRSAITPAPDPVVYLGNVYNTRDLLIGPHPKQLRYDSLEAIVADGWEVD